MLSMAAPTTAETQQIANKLEDTYKSLQRTSSNIRSLLVAGRATCDEIKAYNLWALATYNLQRGMLTTLRAAGESGVPELPPYPTLFAWKGVPGAEAWKVDCKREQQGLTGALRDAMNLGPQTIYLSTKEIDVYSGNQANIPTTGPSFAMVTQASGELGLPILVIVIIAATVIGITAVGMAALSAYWKEQSIQYETTERAHIQAAAFEKYTATRVACYQDCLARGNDVSTCTNVCQKLVDKPNIKIDSARAVESPAFITAGAIVAIAGIATVLLVWRRRKRISAHLTREVQGEDEED